MWTYLNAPLPGEPANVTIRVEHGVPTIEIDSNAPLTAGTELLLGYKYVQDTAHGLRRTIEQTAAQYALEWEALATRYAHEDACTMRAYTMRIRCGKGTYE